MSHLSKNGLICVAIEEEHDAMTFVKMATC